MSKRHEASKKYHDERLKPLVGGIITLAEGQIDKDLDEVVPYIVVKGTDGKEYHLWAMRDDEGNGAGTFQIQAQ